MAKHTTHTQGLEKPHKREAPKPGVGSYRSNTRSINTERSGKGVRSNGGVASTFFGNSRSIDDARGRK